MISQNGVPLMTGAGVAAARERIEREFAVVHGELSRAFAEIELELDEKIVDAELGQIAFTDEDIAVAETVELVEIDENATFESTLLRCEQSTSTPVGGGSESRHLSWSQYTKRPSNFLKRRLARWEMQERRR